MPDVAFGNYLKELLKSRGLERPNFSKGFSIAFPDTDEETATNWVYRDMLPKPLSLDKIVQFLNLNTLEEQALRGLWARAIDPARRPSEISKQLKKWLTAATPLLGFRNGTSTGVQAFKILAAEALDVFARNTRPSDTTSMFRLSVHGNQLMLENVGDVTAVDVVVLLEGRRCVRVANIFDRTEMYSMGRFSQTNSEAAKLALVEYLTSGRRHMQNLGTNDPPIGLTQACLVPLRDWYDINDYIVNDLGGKPFSIWERPSMTVGTDEHLPQILRGLAVSDFYKKAGFEVKQAPEITFDKSKKLPEPIVMSQRLNQMMWRRQLDDIHVVSSGRDAMNHVGDDDELRAVLQSVLHVKCEQARNRGSQLFNDAKVCLASDFTSESMSMRVCERTYFDGVLTNEIVSEVLEDVDGESDPRFRGSSMFPMDKYGDDGPFVLRDISKSAMSNHIGVSTLLYTANDKKIQLWEQTKGEQNEGLIVPSGSGSSDWSDFSRVHGGDRTPPALLKLLVAVAERELREESDVRGKCLQPPNEIESRLLGYYRWGRRGGKPEFMLLSKAFISSTDLEPNHSEVARTRRLPLVIDASSPAVLRDEAKRLLDGRYQLSIPLWVALTLLLEMRGADAEELSQFLSTPQTLAVTRRSRPS